MKELLLECYSEEIPASLQQSAKEGFAQIFANFFDKNNVKFQAIKTYAGPCRITLHISGLEFVALSEVIRGPRLDVAANVLDGFCSKYKISVNDLIIKTENDATYYYLHKKNYATLESLLISNIPKLLASYTWPKSMYWGNYDIKWIRPLKNILCILDGKILAIEYGHLKANNITFGHKFFSNSQLEVESFDDYAKKLNANSVIFDQDDRKKTICTQLEDLCIKHELVLNSDSKLLEEVIGLVEYPTVLLGDVPEEFMILPAELLISCLKNHQKYFTCNQNNKLANKFLFVCNSPIKDFTKIIQGNEKVLYARLSDALYFYNQDLKHTLESRLPALEKVIFHSKLGTMRSKIFRIQELCKYLYPDDQELHLAAKLCKCDLVSQIVQEFSELQGIISKYYAIADGLSSNIANAIAGHYRPQGAVDEVPNGVAATLSLVDKLDSLVGLFLAQEKATSSKDPYGLRRSAIGILRTILKHQLPINLEKLIIHSIKLYSKTIQPQEDTFDSIKSFILDRLKNLLSKTYSAKLIDCVLDDDLSLIADIETKIEKLADFCKTQNWEIIFGAYKRIANILDKKTSNKLNKDSVKTELFSSKYEQDLFDAANTISINSQDLIQNIMSLNALVEPINQFFDNVLVNDKHAAVAQNRQYLSRYLISIFEQVLSFKKLL
jgi:glycyl-tRNA synthetase beta chain